MQTTKYAVAGIVMGSMVALLHGCGGDSSTTSNTSTTSSSSTVSGTVTGFGSIIVDGQEYPELAKTTYQTERYGKARSLVADGLELGQRVNLTLDSQGNISQAVISPDIEGKVSSITSSVTLSSGSVPAITVAGVLIVANTDSSVGTITHFGGGYTALSDVQLNDVVEIHGLLTSANGVNYVQATYIGKQPSFVGTRITGMVANYSSSSKTFTLTSGTNTITINTANASLIPSTATLSNNALVSVWSSQALSNNTLEAEVISVRSKASSAGTTVAVSGAISNYESQAKFVVNGMTVNASSLSLPSDISALSDGLLVAVSGTIDSNGVLVANKLKVQKSKTSTDLKQVVLHGNISDFISSANFTVRGVVVDASQSPTFDSGKSASDLQDGTFVEIVGKLSNNTVVATAVHFPTVNTTAVLDVKGSVVSYDSTSGLLSVSVRLPDTNVQRTITTTLDSNVTYVNGTASDLTTDKAILLHGVFDVSKQTLTVSTITFLPTTKAATANNVLLNGEITSVTTDSNNVITAFVLRGLTINVGTATVQTPTGTTTTLAVGQRVSVLAQTSSGNTLTALKIVAGRR